MSSERVKIASIEVSDEYCKDILTTCVEGGSCYWWTTCKTTRDADLNVTDIYIVDEENNTWRVNFKDIKAAVSLVPSAKIHDSIKQMIYTDNNDADSADCLLQLALFKEVIYG